MFCFVHCFIRISFSDSMSVIKKSAFVETEKNDNTLLHDWIYNRFFTMMEVLFGRVFNMMQTLCTLFERQTCSSCKQRKAILTVKDILDTLCIFCFQKTFLFLSLLLVVSNLLQHSSCIQKSVLTDCLNRKHPTLTSFFDIYTPFVFKERSKLIWRPSK